MKKRREVNVDEVIEAYHDKPNTDPNGSWTGLSDIDEVPTQDVDDL